MGALNVNTALLRRILVGFVRDEVTKVGLHKGPCIVVNLNDRLDYFGSTVNIAARLPAFSQGGELVFTNEIHEDPELRQFLAENMKDDALSPFTGNLKGFDEPFTMWKLRV